ncbi:MAG: hypothetical protein J0I06_12610 [Planctomycetes bacterium]|nr:hypothetical protein [Planctomycetota bacterium]
MVLWYIVLAVLRSLAAIDPFEEKVIGPTLAILAALAFGLGLQAIRRPGRPVWVTWLSLFVNAGLLLVVVVRLVRWL